MKSRNEVVALVRAKIRLLHLALSTEGSYCGWVGRYYDFCRTLPPSLAHEKKAEEFLTHLAVQQHVAAKTQNQAFAALRILMGHVSIETTAGYKHPVVEAASNPLDDLAR